MANLSNIRIVLVETTHPGNIGGAARALKNMGLDQLVLVSPKDFPSEQALWRAASAQDVLDKVKVVDTLEEAVADCGLVVGTSARGRSIPWPLLTPRECGQQCVVESDQHPVAIIFGREDRGLTNEELHRCQYHVHIPSNPEYSSLNLAAAAQVIAYELRVFTLEQAEGKALHWDEWDMPPAPQKDLELYYAHLQETLERLSFINPDNPRQTVTRLRRLYSRIRMDQMELGILRGMLTAVQNHIYHSNNKVAALEEQIRALESTSKPDGNT